MKKVQKSLNATLEKTEQTLGSLENSLGNNVEASLLATTENSEVNDGLPEGWVRATLADIAMWGSGGTPSRKNADYYGGEIPWVKTGDLGPRYVTAATEFITEEAVKNSSAKYFPKGSVALAMYGATIGKTSILGIDATTNQACAVGKPIENVTSTDYLYYFLKNEKDAFIAKGKGGAQPNISQALIKAHEISLPPLAEQTVIAQTLDTLLAQVDNIKTRLDAIPKILKTFRQSVLAAAVSGKLTEEWRGENECERSFKTLGDAGVNVKTGPFGSALHKADYIEGGVPVINPMHINDGLISPSSSMTVKDEKYEDLKAWHLKVGDVIVGRRGEMGRAAVFKSDDKMLCGTGSMVLRGDKNISSEYLCIILRSPTAIAYFVQGSVGSTMVNLNQKIIKALEVYFPPIKEQTEIVRRVEELFAFADQIEQQVKNAQGRVNNLTQSILAKAFRGELTAQWRADNPDLVSGDNSAEVLLEKIKQEREALKKSSKPKKKAARKPTVNKSVEK